MIAREPGGEPKVLIRGGSDAVYVPTGHLVYAVGNVLYAIAFDLDRLETVGGPVTIVNGVQRSALRRRRPLVRTTVCRIGETWCI